MSETPRFVVVATPIGNLDDISKRAIDALSSCDVVACEDTRRTSKLLSHIGASPRLVVVNEHTEREATENILAALAEGKTVGLVSDAGMPVVSDPGAWLVNQVIASQYEVDVIPGPSAVLTALVHSGFLSNRFVFEGFLPRKGSARQIQLQQIAAEERTIVLFEAPHRLARSLKDLLDICGSEREVVLARELTKMHQEIWRGSLSDAVNHCDEKEPRGEYVIVLAGALPKEIADDIVIGEIKVLLAGGTSKKEAAATVAKQLGVAKNRAYELALQC